MARKNCRRRYSGPAALIGALLAVTAASSTAHASGGSEFVEVQPDWSASRIWNEALMQSIRRAFPNPPLHARNLFHLGAAKYTAWSAYGGDGTPYFVVDPATATDIEQARAEAISFAAYRILRHRFAASPNWDVTEPMLDDVFDQADALFNFSQGKDFISTEGDSPAALGNRIAMACMEFGFDDGANELNGYADYTGYDPVNPPLIFELLGVGPDFVDVNHWQPLAFDFYIKQNGIIIGEFIQEIVAPWGGYVTPFALPADQFDPKTGIYAEYDPGAPYLFNTETHEQFVNTFVDVIAKSAPLDPTKGPGAEMIDIGPRTNHNNSLGAQDGEGYYLNPYTGEPYEPVMVPAGDYYRVLAEFWADGPNSETPPGHWHDIANKASDRMDELGIPFKVGGTGEPVNRLEWDTKMYFGLGGSVHDAAIVAWGVKRQYDYVRPISAIRYLASLGQSSDPDDISYNPLGLPLIEDLIDIIRPGDTMPGGRFEHLAEFIEPIFPWEEPYWEYYEGHLVLNNWQGYPEDPETEIGGVGWILAERWMPYQLTTFITPAFPGYVSGHSTFSRTAAEYLTGFTGSEYFPGGLGTQLFVANEYLKFENGPSVDVVLSWAKYKDAADEAGISRLYGGIHPYIDDFPARILGDKIGKEGWQTAQQYFNGTIGIPACAADLSSSGVIDTVDLNLLLGAYGNSDAGDINSDGVTDMLDLAMLLANFGADCP